MGTTCCSPNVEVKELVRGPDGVTILDPDVEGTTKPKETQPTVKEHLKSKSQESKPSSPQQTNLVNGDLTKRTNIPGDTPPKVTGKSVSTATGDKKVSTVRNNLKNL